MNYKDNLVKPVLFMVFNRPSKTQQVFNAIKSAKPKKLYVAADAPRDNVSDDLEKCKEVRSIVSQIDWDCDAKFLFHEKNLGCSLAGVTAWNWLFSQEKEMIFLEDDGIPSQSFFWFCQELLDKYENNHKISHICGQNFGKSNGNKTYFFTRYAGGTWGFATWKRTHELFEYKLESYNETINQKSFVDTFLFNFEYRYMKRYFKQYIKNGGNTYDLQHSYLLHKYDWLDIMPNTNLVTNIGFDLDAANTIVERDSEIALKFGNLPRYELDEIVHPDKIEINKEFEKEQLLHRVFQDKLKVHVLLEVYFPFITRIFRKLMKIIKHLNKYLIISNK
jgi:hypothetical protein